METPPNTPVESAPPIKNVSQPEPSTGAEDKTVAVLSYCTLIGLIIAIILHQQKKTKLGAYHLRQVLGYIIAATVGGICFMIICAVAAIVVGFVSKWLAGLLVGVFWFAFFISTLVLWVMGILAAIQGEKKPMPVVGAYFQKWFGNVFE